MFTIIYDGNFFVQKTLAISLDLFKTNQTKKQKENSKLEFITTLCIHITSDFRKFSSISDSVIFCVDSKSWRKEFNTEYKGTRTKSSELDWDLYYECFNDFINILKLNNIVVSKVDSCEADDLYWYWINRLKNEDKSSITLSADRDLLQLMYSNEFSDNIFYSPTQKKIYTTPEFKEKTDLDILEIDIFNVDSNSIYDKLNDFITTNKLDIDYTIKTEEFLFYVIYRKNCRRISTE
jgi:5'-3' exonuclease